ncbi:MAG TPA: BREX-1 system adenine-specific DNA-methyltransferase PglX, partial [Gallicola sp.]|nr:BREX-1 system adenine-specific DNA-methyltransferase PglX [Gallicola sp.]
TLTQVFTPDWIVRYMAENSVGRIWLESYPNSSLKSEMKYYVEDAEQEQEVQRKLDEIKYRNVNPEDIKIIEPCCGSGHILVYIFDLLFKMYEEKGYQTREIPTFILRNNLVGLEIDKRAAQLASFSLVMKARSLNSRFFSDSYYVRPKVFEIWDSRALLSIDYEAQLKELNLLSNEEIKNIKWLVETFRYAKTIGSLLKIEKKNFDEIERIINKVKKEAVPTIFNMHLLNEGLICLDKLLSQARVMTNIYDVIITNPPYLSFSKLEKTAKDYYTENYTLSKTDMFAMFMELPYIRENGFRALVNPDSWMFLSSFEEFRYTLLSNETLINMIHIGLGGFDAVVQTTTFIIRKNIIEDYKTVFIRLENIGVNDKENIFHSQKNNPIFIKISEISAIPGSPLAYFATNETIEFFKHGILMDKVAEPRQGIIPGKVEAFLRLWYEVEYNKIGKNHEKYEDINKYRFKWFPYNKGGAFRKWYGNIEYVINMENNGYDIQFSGLNNNYRLRDPKYYFKEAVTWSKINSGRFSARIMEKGNLFDIAGCSIFELKDNLKYVLGLMNSSVVSSILEFLSPTLNYEVDHIKKIPVEIKNKDKIENLVDECIQLAREDWDSFETSMNFQKHPLLGSDKLIKLYDSYNLFVTDNLNKLRDLELQINKDFALIYNAKSINTNPIEEDLRKTIRIVDKNELMKSLVSYLVGVEMGRYSLDSQGIIYAGGEWTSMKYVTYQPDDDGIIPIYNELGMSDGLTSRIIGLIKHIYGENWYRDNIDFVADALGKKNNESSEETLNRYLNDEFYNDHVKMYKKRPIYWMFSSGKKNAFKCLIYMHRYSEDTLAIINSKYFLNESA